MKQRLDVFSDGGARGNPGPSAIAYIVLDEHEHVLERYSRRIGIKTNNQAEYEALIAAMRFASKLDPEEIAFHIDSELVAKHLKGQYRVKSPQLKPLWLEVQQMKQVFKKVKFVHVLRSNRYIEQADEMVNAALDQVSHD